MSNKITKATLKSFIKKNLSKLYIAKLSSFNAMTDGVEHSSDKRFQPIVQGASYVENTLGIEGVWLVGSSRDYFRLYEFQGMVGIEVSNCCGSFILAVRDDNEPV